MRSVLVLYMSRGGHTARIARRICESICAAGGRAEMMDINEASHEGVDWAHYDVVALGAPVLYGSYDKDVLRFVERHRDALDRKPNSFFNVLSVPEEIFGVVPAISNTRRQVCCLNSVGL